MSRTVSSARARASGREGSIRLVRLRLKKVLRGAGPLPQPRHSDGEEGYAATQCPAHEMQDHPARRNQNDQQDRERLCCRTENAERRADDHTGQNMRWGPGERRYDIDGIELADRHPQHVGEERNEGADARCEACKKNTLVPVTREKASLR